MVYLLRPQASIPLNIVLGFTALYNSENAFSLRNQGKGVFCFYTHSLPIVCDTKPQSHKEIPWSRGVLQYAPRVASLIFLEC